MAIRTKISCEFEGGAANGGVTWEYDWDDVTLKLKEFRCVNNTPHNSRGTLTSLSTGDAVSQVVGPEQPAAADLAIYSVSPWKQQIATGVANRFSLTVDSRGRLVGLNHTFMYPA